MERVWQLLGNYSLASCRSRYPCYPPASAALGHPTGKYIRQSTLMPQSRWIPALPTWKDAVFAGYFGPIGEYPIRTKA